MKIELKVRKYDFSSTSRYVVRVPSSDKRKRVFFETKSEGLAYVRKLKARLNKEGDAALTLPESVRVEAGLCSGRLLPFGKTITDATEHYIKYLESLKRSVAVSEIIPEFIKAKIQDGLAKRSIIDFKTRLNAFEATFGGTIIANISTLQIDDWLRNLNLAAQTRNNFRKVLSGFFKYALIRKYVDSNPVTESSKAKVVRPDPVIYTPEQLKKLLANAPKEFIPFLVIGAFAGVRPEEMQRLDWSRINLERKKIDLSAEKTKTAKRRLVPIQDNLYQWLIKFKQNEGLIITNLVRLRERTCKAAGIKWVQDGLRHSYASYRLAQTSNPQETAVELGHASINTLYQHYRELVTAESAQQWFDINPDDIKQPVSSDTSHV